MSQEKITLTNAVRGGRLRATEMEIGDSIVGTLKGFKTNTYGGENAILEVNGQEVEILVAGNLKFLAKDVAAEKRQLGKMTTITRVDNKEKDGRTYTSFKITQAGSTNAAPAATSAKANLKAELAAIRGAAK